MATVVITRLARKGPKIMKSLLPNMNEKSESFYGNLKNLLCPVAKGKV